LEVAVSRQPTPLRAVLAINEKKRPNPHCKRRGNLSLVYANTMRADAKEAEIELANGVIIKGGAVEDVVAIQLLDGRFVYLSDLKRADYRSVPYLTLTWPLMRNRNVLGEPIVVRGKRYLTGIGMHSAARLTFPLEGKYRRFDSAVALDDSAKGRGSVTFAIYVKRDNKWAEAYTSHIVRGADEPQPISVDLRGAQGLTLTTDFADRGDELDRAVWLDARLVR
jgi:NPCBM/NEW2 domain